MKTPLLECQSICKTFGDFTAVNEVNLKLAHQEFLVLLGPSGCGKTTILRMIAGLESLDAGKILLQNQLVSDPKSRVSPEKRGLGLVFQNNSLFPHLNVAQNIGYGLHGSKPARQERVQEMLALVDLSDSSHKMPHMLSGGQQQRVAVARALAPSPKLLLLDEPFNSLDYQLRVQLRQDIRDVLKQEQVSVILVTHDQAEAYTFADRLAVVRQGKIAQAGHPAEIYHSPVNAWVASFVGEANFLPLEVALKFLKPPHQTGDFVTGLPLFLPEKPACLMIRPHDVVVEKTAPQKAHGIVQAVEFSGEQQRLTIRLHEGRSLKACVPSRERWQPQEPLKVKIAHFVAFPA